MADWERSYLCIDLKSFYASVECVERGLDPMTTDLVVADPERSSTTICLAVSPSLKAKGVKNRCRVFQIPAGMDYITAPPRMQLYIDYSARVYGVYLKYIAKEDIHVYSIDEAFLDVTGYLGLYRCTARELGERIRQDVLDTTGIPATCGMGPNLYLAKIALDITAKHSPDFFGVLDEDSFKETMWNHRPITDFWRIGPGTQRRLATLHLETMGQVALYPHPEKLYDLLGIDAEILIDHAWGREPVTIADIKAYRSKSRSLTNAQVLQPHKYTSENGLLIAKEMCDQLSLELVEQGLVCGSVTFAVGVEGEQRAGARGSVRFPVPTNSSKALMAATEELYADVVEPGIALRHLMLVFNNVTEEGAGQLDLFADEAELAEEKERAHAISKIKEKFGKNAILKGMDLLPDATARERNLQIGGHKSGEAQ